MKNLTLKSFLVFLFAVSGIMTGNAQRMNQLTLKAKVKAQLMSNKPDSARYYSQKLLAMAPSAENYLLAGSVSEIANDHMGADKLYQQALTVAPDSERYKILSALGYVSLNRGDTSSALNYQRRSLSLNIKQAEPHYILSLLYQMKNQPDSVEYHAKKAYELDSSKVDYIRLIANAEYQKGDMISSIRYLRRLYNVRKSSMDADSNKTKDALANFYLKVDDYKNALKLLVELTGDSTKKDVYFYSIAKCYYALNENESALQNISKAITLSQSSQLDYYELQINIYEAMGQHSRIIADYLTGNSKGLQGYSDWLSNYRIIINKTQQINSRLAGEKKDDQKNDLFTLAKLYLFAKDDNNAIRVLNDYCRLGGSLTDSVYAVYSNAYAGLNLLSEAKTAIFAAIKFAPENLNYQYMLLSIAYRQQDYREVINILSKENKNTALIDPELKNTMLFKSYTILGDTTDAMKFNTVIY